MSTFNTSETISLGPKLSLTPEQIQSFPAYSNISSGTLLTPVKVATAYGIPASTGAGVKVGIISLGGGFSQTDLNMSMSDLGITAPTITFVGVDGAVNNYTGDVNSGDTENALDLVCVAGMVPSANIILYAGLNEDINYSTNIAVANALNNTSSFGNAIQRAVDDNCDVISISWGTGELAKSGGYTYFCGDFLNGPLSNAAAKGISVFVAAGDWGSTPVAPLSAPPEFMVQACDYPSVNKNVVSVGGTFLTLTGSNTRSTETVYNNSESIPGMAGGGGVSEMISLPTYQSNLTYKSYPDNVTHALTSRGIPDISLAMNAYGVWLNGTIYGVSGTSASAPIMAGITARHIALNGGRRPPQPLNKILYNNANAYYDITTGNNSAFIATGYSATLGWDAATGYGSISNGIQFYRNFTSAGMSVKTNTGWNQLQTIKIKKDSLTWTTVNKVWVKTASGWTQVY